MPNWMWFAIIAIALVIAYYAYKHIKAAKESPLDLATYMNIVFGKSKTE
jgi:hypothetical protein